MSSSGALKSLPRRYNKLDRKTINKFLKQLELTGNLEASARSLGLSPQSIYKKMKALPVLKDAVDAARAKVVTEAEEELRRRAIEGVDRGVYYKGELIAVEKHYSDPLLIELLKANAPQRYGAKNSPLVQINNNNVNIEDRTTVKLANLLGIDSLGDEIGEIQDVEYRDISEISEGE